VRLGERLPHQLDRAVEPIAAGEAAGETADPRGGGAQAFGGEVAGGGDEQLVPRREVVQ
jgi:hypothetical protein